MKKKLIFIVVILILVTSAFQVSPYARRIRPFSSTPVACQENEIGYNMTSHSLVICTNSGFVSLATGGSGGTAAPVDATYITKTANSTLLNEFALASLATGILKNTTTTGIPTIAIASDFPADSGLPTQTGNSGKFLTTNGTISSWNTISTGITNGAEDSVIPKSDGVNLVASRITDSGSTIYIPSEGANDVITIGDKIGTHPFIEFDNSAGDYIDIDAQSNGLIDVGSASRAQITVSSVDKFIDAKVAASGGSINFFNVGGTVALRLNSNATTITLTAATSVNLTTPILKVNAIVTTAGTTGAQTINKSAGSVNFGVGATSLVVTNSTVTPDSIINCPVQTNDTTLKSVQCVASSGSFTMFANAAAAAETRVGFIVVTPQ